MELKYCLENKSAYSCRRLGASSDVGQSLDFEKLRAMGYLKSLPARLKCSDLTQALTVSKTM